LVHRSRRWVINGASRSAGNLDERGLGNITILGAAATYGFTQTKRPLPGSDGIDLKAGMRRVAAIHRHLPQRNKAPSGALFLNL
jgi:hypothetical protein